MPTSRRRITKSEAERLLAAVEAAGDDPSLVRAALMPWAPADLLDGLDLDGLYDLAARLNEEREL